MDSPTTSKTRWHRLLGALLEKLLTPVEIHVSTEVQVTSMPPQIDVVLLRRSPGPWTEAQRNRLPDGIRDSQVNVIVLEFKYSESLDADALRQTLCYDYFYRQTQGRADHEIQTFLILAKQPQAGTLAKFAYEATPQPGIYRDSHWLLNNIPILSLNELPNEPHNVWFKCFASHQAEKRKAFQLLKKVDRQIFNPELEWLLAGLWQHWFTSIGEDMSTQPIELTPEQITAIGQFWWPIFQSRLSVEERLAGLKLEDRLLGLKLEDRLLGVKPEDVLSRFKPKERLEGLSLAELDEIETYLQEQRQQSASQKH